MNGSALLYVPNKSIFGLGAASCERRNLLSNSRSKLHSRGCCSQVPYSRLALALVTGFIPLEPLTATEIGDIRRRRSRRQIGSEVECPAQTVYLPLTTVAWLTAHAPSDRHTDGRRLPWNRRCRSKNHPANAASNNHSGSLTLSIERRIDRQTIAAGSAMKYLLVVFGSIALAAWPSPRSQAGLRDPSAVLARVREALGGEERLASVRSFVATGRTRRLQGDNLVPIEFEIACQLPEQVRQTR